MPAARRTPKTKDPTAGGSGDRGKGKDTAGEKGSDKVRAQKEREVLAAEKAAVKVEQKKRDRAQKRSGGKLSCAECRRLKLKCDREIPCGSCQRRGCEEVCPNGTFATGKGTRFMIVGTEVLHTKIEHLVARIRELEAALPAGDPLLEPDRLEIASLRDLHIKPDVTADADIGPMWSGSGSGSGSGGGAAAAKGHTPDEDEEYSDWEDEEERESTPAGTLQVRHDGACTFYGRSAGYESLLLASSPSPSFPSHPTSLRLFPSPVVSSLSRSKETALSDLSAHLPPYARAHTLLRAYLRGAPWQAGAAVEGRQAWGVLGTWYAPMNSQAPAMSPAAEDVGAVGEEPKTPHTLSLLFTLLAIGAFSRPPFPASSASPFSASPNSSSASPGDGEASGFYALAHSAFKLGGLPMGGSRGVGGPMPSIAGTQVLVLMSVYLALGAGQGAMGPSFTPSHAAYDGSGATTPTGKIKEEDDDDDEEPAPVWLEMMWGALGLATSMGISIGLHRDPVHWALPPHEVQKRRALFWELFVVDSWMTLATGRVPAFPLAFVDTEHAEDTEKTLSEDGEDVSSFPAWRVRFTASCLAPVVSLALAARVPATGNEVMKLDKRIREFPVPLPAAPNTAMAEGDSDVEKGQDDYARAMAEFMPKFYKLAALNYLHRTLFARALVECPADPTQSAAQGSFLAGYHSACDLLGAARGLFSVWPAEAARTWNMWAHIFGSAMMLSTIVIRATGDGLRSKFASMALAQVKNAYELLEDAATYGGKAVRFVPALHDALQKALQVMNGTLTVPRNDIFGSGVMGIRVMDELEMFVGGTRLIVQSRRSESRRPSVHLRAPPAPESKRLASTIFDDPTVSLFPVSATSSIDGTSFATQYYKAPTSGEQNMQLQEDTRIFDAYTSPGSTGYPTQQFQYSPVEDPHRQNVETSVPVAGTPHFSGSTSLSRRSSVLDFSVTAGRIAQPPASSSGQALNYDAGASSQLINDFSAPLEHRPGTSYPGYHQPQQQQQQPQPAYQTTMSYDTIPYDVSQYDTVPYAMPYQYTPDQLPQQSPWGAEPQTQQQHLYPTPPQPMQQQNPVMQHAPQVSNPHLQNAGHHPHQTSFINIAAMPPPQPPQNVAPPPIRQHNNYDDWGSYSY